MKPFLPCAIYTRKSSEEGLEQGFNSLDAQREACEAYILSQKALGWKAVNTTYDDEGFSGGNTERPALKQLMADIVAQRIRIIVVYKVDRLTRSLADFAKLVELFDAHDVSFVSVTQQFNTTSSMWRLTLNVLLSFAQFEREVTGERIRDKIAASKRKGMWMGGHVPTGYAPHERTLVIEPIQADRIRQICSIYLEVGSVRLLKAEIDRLGWVTPSRNTRRANLTGARLFSRGHLYRILSNPLDIGQIVHKQAIFEGQHPAIIDQPLWQAVQERLATNLRSHTIRSTAADPGLLTGLVFDDLGRRLAPTHTKKGAKRYRYYIGQAILTDNQDQEVDQKTMRWPAQELEGAVLGALTEFLKDESKLMGFLGCVTADEARRCLRQGKIVGEQLGATKSCDRIEVLKRIVERITVQAQNIEIVVRVGEILASSDGSGGAQTAMIDVPVELKRRGHVVRLIVHTLGVAAPMEPDLKLVAVVAKAHEWFGRLRSGKTVSVQAIATEEKVDRSYARPVIYLAFLAPDIVQRIMKGDHPPSLNATRLIRMTPLPMAWDEQRALLGLSS